MSTRIRPRAFDEQVHLLCTVVRYWRGRGDAISVLSGLVTTPSRFQWEERVVYVRCAIARRAWKCIMHAYVTVSDTASIRGRLRVTPLHVLRGTQSRFFVWFAHLRIVLLAARWWIEACPPDSIRILESDGNDPQNVSRVLTIFLKMTLFFLLYQK